MIKIPLQNKYYGKKKLCKGGWPQENVFSVFFSFFVSFFFWSVSKENKKFEKFWADNHELFGNSKPYFLGPPPPK